MICKLSVIYELGRPFAHRCSQTRLSEGREAREESQRWEVGRGGTIHIGTLTEKGGSLLISRNEGHWTP